MRKKLLYGKMAGVLVVLLILFTTAVIAEDAITDNSGQWKYVLEDITPTKDRDPDLQLSDHGDNYDMFLSYCTLFGFTITNDLPPSVTADEDGGWVYYVYFPMESIRYGLCYQEGHLASLYLIADRIGKYQPADIGMVLSAFVLSHDHNMVHTDAAKMIADMISTASESDLAGVRDSQRTEGENRYMYIVSEYETGLYIYPAS